MRIKFLVILLFFAAKSIYGQHNLIPNGSFEHYKGKSKNMIAASPWKGINSADHFKLTHPKDTGMCRGARTGKAYAGIRFQSKYQEFIEVALSEKLKKDSLYHIEMYVRAAHFSNVLLSALGFHFSVSGFKNYRDLDIFNTFMIADEKGFSRNHCWIKVEADFKAQGGEKMMMIGNFNPETKEDFIRVKKLNSFLSYRECYYFIDDVLLFQKSTAGIK
jgi:OmpA-OmpF porin, OOP family